MLERYKGTNVFVRTITHHYTGRLAGIEDGFLLLEEAAWIADDGRFADALAEGTLSEVEPFPGECAVGVGSIVDISAWAHDLPRTQK